MSEEKKATEEKCFFDGRYAPEVGPCGPVVGHWKSKDGGWSSKGRCAECYAGEAQAGVVAVHYVWEPLP